MRNKEKCFNQNMLFEHIKQILPQHVNFTDEICDLLKIGVDSAYRRIRCDKLLSFEEALIICKHFGISVDFLFLGNKKDEMQCKFAPYDIQDQKEYLNYMKELSSTLESIMKTGGKIMMSSADIPAFHYLAYKELALFQVFSWHKNVCNVLENFDDFLNQFYDNETMVYYEKIVRSYKQIPSSEIWTSNTIETTLRLLCYHFEMKHFKENKTPYFICEQLLDMLTVLHNRMDQCANDLNNNIFKFYISDIDIGNTLILFKQDKQSSCLVRLFTVNGLSITDDNFCNVVENWLNNLIKRATLISEASEKERFKFFDSQKKKIESVMGTFKYH